MLDFRQSLLNSALNKVLQRLHYPLEVMLTCVRWYVAYPLSLRHIEEMMHERGVFVDHSTVHRWAIKRVICARCRLSQAQTPPWSELADEGVLHQGVGPVEVSLPRS